MISDVYDSMGNLVYFPVRYPHLKAELSPSISCYATKGGLAMTRQGVAFAVVILLLSGCAGPQATGLVPADFSSNWVEVSSGGVIGEPGGKPELLFTVRNKSERRLWVKVRFAPPSPNPECVLSKKLEPGEKSHYPCRQEKMVPDADYPIFVSVHFNEGLTDQAETAQTKMRFSKRDVDAFEKFLTPPTLPATFKGISSTKEPGIGTALFGPLASMFADDSSTLVVRQDSIEYTSKDKTFAIPVSQVRSVQIKQYDKTGLRAWVVVEYTEPDGNKVIAFQGNPNRVSMDTLQEIERAIRYVVMKRPKGTQDK